MTARFEALKQAADERWRDLHSQQAWIRVGSALCGEAAGAEEVIEALREEVSRRGIEATISITGCAGLCYAEPLVDILTPGGARVFYNNVTPENVPQIVESHIVNGQPNATMAYAQLGDNGIDGIAAFNDLPMMKGQVRIALRNAGNIDPNDINQYIANGGYAGLDRALTAMTPEEVLKEIQDSGLRGRGGAAFPTGVKWSFLVRSTSPRKYILCNCEEGDPGAFNDKGILESDPHTLIEGAIIAGYVTGASNGIIFIRHGHDGPIDKTQQALKQAYEAGLLGENILGTDFSFDIEVSLTGESYVAGEETALMESIEGKRAMPRFRPPFPAAFGVWGYPSNINNIKTLAYVPEIVSKGSEWFSSIGYERSKGTAIICLSGHIQRQGMIEVPMGITINQVLYDIGGGPAPGHSLRMLQTGGPLGGVLSADKASTLLDFESMAAAGAILGSGGIIVADERTCAVNMARVLAAFCQFESCGKCFPCRLGTAHLVEVLERISRCESRAGDLELMRSVGGSMAASSLCGHGQLGWNPIQSALNYFADDFRAHIVEGRCPTGQCSEPILAPDRTRPHRWDAPRQGSGPVPAGRPALG